MSSSADARAALFRDVRHHAGGPLASAGLLMAAGALAEGIGLLSLLPLLSLASRGSLAIPGLPARALPRLDPWLVALPLFLLVMAGRALILQARDRATARLENCYDISLRLRAANTLAARGWPFAARVGQAGMQSLLANDVPRTGVAVHYGLAVVTAAFLLAVQLMIASALSPVMALGALGLLLLGLPSLIALARRSFDSGKDIADGQDESARAAFTFNAGLKAALAQGTVRSFLTGYEAMLARLGSLYLRYTTDLAWSRTRHSIIAAVGAVTVLGACHLLQLSLAKSITLLILFARMSGPAQALQQGWAGMTAYTASFAAIIERLGPLLDHVGTEADVAPLCWRAVELQGIGLVRDGRTSLQDVNLRIEPGEWIAVEGPSGAGKTTLLDIVAGLLPDHRGRLLVDGAPLEGERMAAWRAGLAYVGQQERPFDVTVRALLGDASDERCWDVLGVVGLSDLVRADPAGLDLPLADSGTRLSGGERQRLMIARALLRRPRLLLLDEATAAIDVAGERVLAARLRSAIPSLAVLLVAHRQESIALCDRELTIDAAR